MCLAGMGIGSASLVHAQYSQPWSTTADACDPGEDDCDQPPSQPASWLAVCSMPSGSCEPIFVDTYDPPTAPDDPEPDEESIPSLLRAILDFFAIPLSIGGYLADTWSNSVVTLYPLAGCDAYEGTKLGLSHSALARAYRRAASQGHGNLVPIDYDRRDWEYEMKAKGFKSWKERGECSTFPEFR